MKKKKIEPKDLIPTIQYLFSRVDGLDLAIQDMVKDIFELYTKTKWRGERK